MRVRVERTGGLAGMRLASEVAEEHLSRAEAAELRALVERAGFFALPSELRAPPPARADRLHYRIVIEDGARAHTVAADEAALPDALRPLLDRVAELARRGARPGGR